MLQKLLAGIESANFKSAVRQGRLACPACRAAPGRISPAADDVITCAKCGAPASALEWASAASAAKLIGDPDKPPASTKITRQTDAAGGTIWNIPSSGKSGGLMFFAAFWCGITAVVTGGVLFGGSTAEGNFSSAVGLALFLALFWAVGLGMAYAACRSKYAKHRLTVDASTITLARELFGRKKEMGLPVESVQSIAAVEFYQRNYQPVHGVEIRSPQGKLRFGSMLAEEEKAWLIADLKRVVFGSDPSGAVAAPARSSQSVAARPEFFSVPLPTSPRSWLGPGLMLVVMGVAALLVGVFVIDRHFTDFPRSASGDGPVGSVFDLFHRSFRVLWLGGSSLFVVIGTAMLIRYARARHHQTHLEGTKDEVVLRTTKFGRIVEQRPFPRAEVVDVRASVVGSSNGKPMKRIELLIGQKSHTLGRWFDGERADAFVAEVRRSL